MALPAILDEARSLTIQSDTRKPVNESGPLLVNWIAQAGLYIPSWWSPYRDTELRKFWKRSDHLSGAIYAMTSKMTAIPRRVVARDQSIREYVRQAEELTDQIQGSAQFGEGWEAFFSKFVEDMLVSDNGSFAEIIGLGPITGPILGRPLSIAHMDSSRCTRTGNSEYPVLYRDIDNRSYKLHYSRVMFASQMPSPIADMHGVGFSAVSRCINVAQTLIDILQFKQEKLGSRPHRAIIIPRGGLDPQDITNAFRIAENAMDSAGLARYSKVVVTGSQTLPEADLKVIELSQLPDGFNEETSITLGMATIALAFGVDARELFPAMSAGATRADALLAHLKQRGKAPGQIIQTVEQLFDHKYLPPQLMFEFDFQDDAQDRQVADIRHVRSQAITQGLNSGVINARIGREKMLTDGDINRSQFERMELADGRLPDGTTVLALFYTKDPNIAPLVDVGADDPLDLTANDPDTMMQVIREKMAEVNGLLVNEKNELHKQDAFLAAAALTYLEKYYQNYGTLQLSMLGEEANRREGASKFTPVDALRRENLTEPNQEEELDVEGRNRLEESSDDDPNMGS